MHLLEYRYEPLPDRTQHTECSLIHTGTEVLRLLHSDALLLRLRFPGSVFSPMLLLLLPVLSAYYSRKFPCKDLYSVHLPLQLPLPVLLCSLPDQLLQYSLWLLQKCRKHLHSQVHES